MQQDLLNNTLRAGLSQIGIDLNAPIAPDDPRLKGHTWGEFVTELLASLQDRPGLLMVLDQLAAYVQLSTMKSSFENPRLASLLGEASRSLWNITVGDFEDLLNEMLRQDGLQMDDLTDEDILALFTQFEKRASVVTLSFAEEFSEERTYRLIRIRRWLNNLVDRMGFDPSDTVFHLYLHWRELVDELAEALVDGKFPIRVRPISALIQFIAITAVDCAQTACELDKAGRLQDALGELEADRQLIVERLSGFSSVFNLMLKEAGSPVPDPLEGPLDDDTEGDEYEHEETEADVLAENMERIEGADFWLDCGSDDF